MGSALAMTHELAFKAHTPSDAEKWWNVIRQAAGDGAMTGSTPTTPVESRNVSGQQAPPQYQDTKQPAPLQTQTGYHTSPINPGQGAVPGSAGGVGQQHTSTPISGGTGASPATGAPSATSGLDRAPGQY